MNQSNTKKLAIAGILCAVAVVGSLFTFPVLASKCAPIQHMVNVLCAVLLGPWYGVGVAFGASLIRNLLGLGTIMAFPGSMCCLGRPFCLPAQTPPRWLSTPTSSPSSSPLWPVLFWPASWLPPWGGPGPCPPCGPPWSAESPLLFPARRAGRVFCFFASSGV